MAKSRTIQTALVRFLNKSAHPVYVLDHERKVVFCNDACSRWVGVDVEQLAGTQCNYHSAGGRSAAVTFAAALCPAPSALSGEAGQVVLTLPAGSGRTSTREAFVYPVQDSDEELLGALIVVSNQEYQEEGPASPALSNSSTALHARLIKLHQQQAASHDLSSLIGDSATIQRVRRQAVLAIENNVNVLIVGPVGSGKEHLARSIHYSGAPENVGLLYLLDCSVLDAESLQNQVLRFKKDIAEFKDLSRPRLILLNIDQLPTDAQRELHGLLQLPDFNVLTIATSSHGLQRRHEGDDQFLEPLADELSTLTIELHALSDRRREIPLIAQAILEEFNAKGGKQLAGFTEDALDRLIAYPWPGNFDELKTFVFDSCERCQESFVATSDLPKKIKLAEAAERYGHAPDESLVLDDFLREVESELIQRALRLDKGNKSKAANRLGMTRARLHRRIEQLGIEG